MKPYEETWRADGTHVWCDGAHIATFSGAESDEVACPRVRLAASAPDLYRAAVEWRENTTAMLNMLVQEGVSEAIVSAAVDMMNPSGVASMSALKKARGET